MNTRAELNAWLATATPEQIVDRLERAERESFFWHIATTLSGPTVAEPLIRAVEKTAADLIEGGYRRE